MAQKHHLSWGSYLFTLLVIAILSAASAIQAGLDEWTLIGPLGGSIAAVAVNQNDCDSIYAVTGGNLYVTGDQGYRWEHITAAPNDLSDIYIDPERTATLYAIAIHRLYGSTDAGASWTELTSSVYSFVLDPQNSARMYAGSRDGVIRKSIDGGSIWSVLTTGSSWYVISIAVSHAAPNTVYAGTMGDWDFPGDGVFKTTDGGLNWFPADSLLPSTNINSLVIDPLQPETVYAGTVGSGMSYSYGAYRSTNGGLSWEETNAGLPDHASISMLRAVPGQSGLLYTGLEYGGFYKSDDGGAGWSEVDLGLDEFRVVAIDFCPQDTDALFIGSDNGLLKMTSWYDKAAIIGVAPFSINAVAVDPYDPDIIYAGGYTLYKSSDGGLSWDLFNIGLEPLEQGCQGIVINPSNTDVVFTCNYYIHSNVYKSTDGAATWNISLADAAINDIAIDPHGSDTLYTGGLDEPFVGAMWKSIDGGGSWSVIDNSVIASIALDPIHPGVLYTGTSKEGVKKSTDGGATWSFVNNGLPEPGVSANFFHGVTIDPVDPDILYCGPSNAGVYKSTNSGAEWFDASGDLPYLDVRDIEIDPVHPSVVYAGVGGHGVYRSIDGGSNWEAMNAGLPAGQYVNIEIDPVSPNILYGCCSAGLFRYESSFDPTTDAEAVTVGNYPDAVIYGTTIEYSLELPCHVQMKVYNVAGKEVAAPVDMMQSAGRHTVDLDANNLSSGVYFVKMMFGSRTITKKCVLIR